MAKPTSETILLLASDAVIRKVICEALESQGYFVLTAHDLSSAKEWLKECTPHLLMIRHYIESVPGHEAAMYLRSIRPGIPVLMVGGLLDHPGLENREILHGFEIFPRPFQAAELLDKVKEMLLKYSLRNKPDRDSK
jgi:DNA-binding NtrC family response regulator